MCGLRGTQGDLWLDWHPMCGTWDGRASSRDPSVFFLTESQNSFSHCVILTPLWITNIYIKFNNILWPRATSHYNNINHNNVIAFEPITVRLHEVKWSIHFSCLGVCFSLSVVDINQLVKQCFCHIVRHIGAIWHTCAGFRLWKGICHGGVYSWNEWWPFYITYITVLRTTMLKCPGIHLCYPPLAPSPKYNAITYSTHDKRTAW